MLATGAKWALTLLHTPPRQGDPHLGLAPSRCAGWSSVAEANHNPGRNPKAGQDILAASQVRLGGVCYSFPWGCLKRTGACRYLGMAITSSLTLLPITYANKARPQPSGSVCPSSPGGGGRNSKPFSQVSAQGASMWAFVLVSCEVSGAEHSLCRM